MHLMIFILYYVIIYFNAWTIIIQSSYMHSTFFTMNLMRTKPHLFIYTHASMHILPYGLESVAVTQNNWPHTFLHIFTPSDHAIHFIPASPHIKSLSPSIYETEQKPPSRIPIRSNLNKKSTSVQIEVSSTLSTPSTAIFIDHISNNNDNKSKSTRLITPLELQAIQ